MAKNFNVIMTGVGGQGIVTLVSILDEACLIEGYDVKSSELHGLSQRGGSVVTHIKFGKNVNSPLVPLGAADLVIGLEPIEALRDAVFSGVQTVFLVNDRQRGFPGYPEKQEIVDGLNKVAKNNLHLVRASDKCEKELGKEVVAGVYLLGYAVKNGLLPLKRESFKMALKNVIPERFLDLNVKAFELAFK